MHSARSLARSRASQQSQAAARDESTGTEARHVTARKSQAPRSRRKGTPPPPPKAPFGNVAPPPASAQCRNPNPENPRPPSRPTQHTFPYGIREKKKTKKKKGARRRALLSEPNTSAPRKTRPSKAASPSSSEATTARCSSSSASATRPSLRRGAWGPSPRRQLQGLKHPQKETHKLAKRRMVEVSMSGDIPPPGTRPYESGVVPLQAGPTG